MAHDSEPRENPHDTFKLSDEYIRSLLHHAAQVLILNGAATVIVDDERLIRDTDKIPHSFSYEVPVRVTKDIFFGNSDDIIVSGAQVQYVEPRRIDVHPYDDEVASLYMSISGKLRWVDVDVCFRYYISNNEKKADVESTVDIEYSRDGRTLSRDATIVPDEQYEHDDVRRYASFLEAMQEMEREMTMDDADQLRQLMEYIQLHPQRD